MEDAFVQLQGHFTFHTCKKPFVLEARERHWPSIIYGSIPSSYHSQSYNFQIRGGCENSERGLFLYIKASHKSIVASFLLYILVFIAQNQFCLLTLQWYHRNNNLYSLKGTRKLIKKQLFINLSFLIIPITIVLSFYNVTIMMALPTLGDLKSKRVSYT
jgi:hypothetical protein